MSASDSVVASPEMLSNEHLDRFSGKLIEARSKLNPFNALNTIWRYSPSLDF